MIWKNKFFTAFSLLVMILVSFWLYKDALNSYFFQDDWFSFRISEVKKPVDFFRFFLPRQDVIYYRPLGIQLPFFLMRNFFQIQSFPFHLVSFLIHILNTVLVFFLTSLLVNKLGYIALLTSFFYATSSIHFIPLVWVSTISFSLGFLLFSLSLIVFIKWTATKKFYYLFLFLIVQLLGLLTNELSMVLPITVFLFGIAFKKFSRYFFVTVVLPALYIVMRLISIPQLTDTYALEFGKKNIKALFVYFLWLFNWPEELKNQVDNILRLNFSFITSFWDMTVILTIITLIFLFLIFKTNINAKILLFYTGNILAGILFPLLFPNHTYSYYLLISGWSLFTILAMSVPNKPIFIFSFCLLWVLSSFYTLKFYYNNHWTIKRSAIAKAIAKDILKRYPNLLAENQIYVNNDNYLRVVLSGEEMFRILYNNSQVRTVYYGSENTIWKNIPETEDQLRKRLDLIYVK